MTNTKFPRIAFSIRLEGKKEQISFSLYFKAKLMKMIRLKKLLQKMRNFLRTSNLISFWFKFSRKGCQKMRKLKSIIKL
jgi:hypothetical protein